MISETGKNRGSNVDAAAYAFLYGKSISQLTTGSSTVPKHSTSLQTCLNKKFSNDSSSFTEFGDETSGENHLQNFNEISSEIATLNTKTEGNQTTSDINAVSLHKHSKVRKTLYPIYEHHDDASETSIRNDPIYKRSFRSNQRQDTTSESTNGPLVAFDFISDRENADGELASMKVNRSRRSVLSIERPKVSSIRSKLHPLLQQPLSTMNDCGGKENVILNKSDWLSRESESDGSLLTAQPPLEYFENNTKLMIESSISTDCQTPFVLKSLCGREALSEISDIEYCSSKKRSGNFDESNNKRDDEYLSRYDQATNADCEECSFNKDSKPVEPLKLCYGIAIEIEGDEEQEEDTTALTPKIVSGGKVNLVRFHSLSAPSTIVTKLSRLMRDNNARDLLCQLQTARSREPACEVSDGTPTFQSLDSSLKRKYYELERFFDVRGMTGLKGSIYVVLVVLVLALAIVASVTLDKTMSYTAVCLIGSLVLLFIMWNLNLQFEKCQNLVYHGCRNLSLTISEHCLLDFDISLEFLHNRSHFGQEYHCQNTNLILLPLWVSHVITTAVNHVFYKLFLKMILGIALLVPLCATALQIQNVTLRLGVVLASLLGSFCCIWWCLTGVINQHVCNVLIEKSNEIFGTLELLTISSESFKLNADPPPVVASGMSHSRLKKTYLTILSQSRLLSGGIMVMCKVSNGEEILGILSVQDIRTPYYIVKIVDYENSAKSPPVLCSFLTIKKIRDLDSDGRLLIFNAQVGYCQKCFVSSSVKITFTDLVDLVDTYIYMRSTINQK